MRVLGTERLQLLVPALELEVAIMQLSQLGLKALNLRLKLPDVFGERLDGALLHVRVWRAVKSQLATSLFKEPEESAWPSEVSLVDLPGHGVGQLRRHYALPSNQKKARHLERKCYT